MVGMVKILAKDFDVVKQAQAAAKKHLEFFNKMMDKYKEKNKV